MGPKKGAVPLSAVSGAPPSFPARTRAGRVTTPSRRALESALSPAHQPETTVDSARDVQGTAKRAKKVQEASPGVTGAGAAGADGASCGVASAGLQAASAAPGMTPIEELAAAMGGSPVGGSPLAFDPIQESPEVSEGGESEDPSYEPEGEDGSPEVSPPAGYTGGYQGRWARGSAEFTPSDGKRRRTGTVPARRHPLTARQT